MSSGARLISAGNRVPSRRSPDSSITARIPRTCGSCVYERRCSTCRSRRAAGTSSSTGWPISSAAWYPNSRSVCSLASRMAPDSSTMTIASGALRTSRRKRSSARRRSLMSRVMDAAPTTVPLMSQIGDTVTDALTVVPSRATRTASWSLTTSPRPTRARVASTAAWSSAGTIMWMLRPMACSAEYPYIRWADGFQLVMVPSRVLPMIAS